MELKKKLLSITVVTTVVMGMAEAALAVPVVEDTAYFVRPALRVGVGEVIEGVQVNGDTEATNSQGVVGYSESTVNLADGTVKMYSEEYSPLNGLQTFGSFGERITIRNGAGTNWDINFGLEGQLSTLGGSPIIPGTPPPQLFYDVGIAVYAPGQADWSNFVGIAYDLEDGIDPILFEYASFIDDIDGTAEEDYYDIFAEVLGSITLETDNEVFDIFAFTNVSVWTDAGNGLEYFEADFLHTASFGQQFAQGVNAYSSSGQFMGLTTPPPLVNTIPEPASLLLFGLGLGVFGVRRKKS